MATTNHIPLFQVGDLVEGNYKGLSKWYPGTIKKYEGKFESSATDFFTILYNDGEIEEQVDCDRIRQPTLKGKKKSSVPPDANSTNTQEIDVLIDELRAVIEKKIGIDISSRKRLKELFCEFDSDGSGLISTQEFIKAMKHLNVELLPRQVSIIFERFDKNGSNSMDYKAFTQLFDLNIQIKNLSDVNNVGSTAHESISYNCGDVIESNIKNNAWTEGKILKVSLNENNDEVYSIKFINGKEYNNISSSHLRKPNIATLHQSNNVSKDFSNDQRNSLVPDHSTASIQTIADMNIYTKMYELGTKVEANFNGRGKWFGGKIIKVNKNNNTYDVEYNDGDKESHVKYEYIRVLSNPPTMNNNNNTVDHNNYHDNDYDTDQVEPSNSEYLLGDPVEANYRESGTWYGGIISEVIGYGVYSVKYDDGETENHVDAHCIRRSNEIAIKKYEVGCKVEANYKKRGKWFAGKIIKINNNNTYDIEYNDGDKEKQVQHGSIRVLPILVSQETLARTGFIYAVGLKVEGNYQGKGIWFPGKIQKVQSDGTYDIMFDDGDVVKSMEPVHIRKIGTGYELKDLYEVDDLIEGNYQQGGIWFPGKVTKVDVNKKLYDVRYDDGEKESGVKHDCIRLQVVGKKTNTKPFESQNDKNNLPKYDVGLKVEGNYQGKGIWFPGKIQKVQSDGTYDIMFDDGDVVKSMEPVHIRKIGTGYELKDLYEVDDLIEGNYQQGGIWFPGKVTKVDVNKKLYDVRYDDGEKESGVKHDCIRLQAGGSNETKQHETQPSKSEFLEMDIYEWLSNHVCGHTVPSFNTAAAMKLKKKLELNKISAVHQLALIMQKHPLILVKRCCVDEEINIAIHKAILVTNVLESRQELKVTRELEIISRVENENKQLEIVSKDMIKYLKNEAKAQGGNKSILMIASERGLSDSIEVLLSDPTEKNIIPSHIDKEDTLGNTALIYASMNGMLSTVEILLKYGAKIDQQNKKGWSSIMYAIANSHHDIVHLLMDKKADVNLSDKKGYTSLMIASENGNESILLFLVSPSIVSNIDLDQQDAQGSTALMKACANGHLNCVKILMKAGANIHCNSNGWNTVLLACFHNHTPIVSLLLQSNLNINSTTKDGWTSLMWCSKQNHVETAKLLLSHRQCSINAQDKAGFTALMRASDNGRIEMVELLCKHHADVNIENFTHKTALTLASAKGFTDIIKLLLKHHAVIDSSKNERISPLLLAASSGHTESARLLLQSGAKVGVCDEEGDTPLIAAAAKGLTDTVKLLLNIGANINDTTKNGNNALMIACINNHVSTASLLLNRGIDKNAQNNNGETALIICCNNNMKSDNFNNKFNSRTFSNSQKQSMKSGFVSKKKKDITFIQTQNESEMMKNRFELVLLLLDKGVDITVRDNDGYDPLLSSIQVITDNNVDVVRLLLDRGANINTQDNHKMTCLVLAACYNNVSVMELLLDRGMNVNESNKEGLTPLMWASKSGNYEASELLIQRKAMINAQDKSGVTALMRTAANGHNTIINLLIKNGASINSQNKNGRSSLMNAAANGQTSTVKLLLENNADINQVNELQTSSLMLAIANGHQDTAELLINLKANFNIKNSEGWSALLLSSQKGLLLILKLILLKGSDINQQNHYGSSALMRACANGHVSIVKYLLDYNKSNNNSNDREPELYINQTDSESWTALHYAVFNEHEDIVRLLISDSRINIKIKNKEGNIPSMIANNNNIQRLLLDKIEE
eukprot:gene6096-8400_t